MATVPDIIVRDLTDQERRRLHTALAWETRRLRKEVDALGAAFCERLRATLQRRLVIGSPMLMQRVLRDLAVDVKLTVKL